MTADFDPARLRTVHLVPLTAFRSDGELHAGLQAEHTARMYAAGFRVFLPAAGTSEFYSLSADEVVELVRIPCEAAGEDAGVFAPVGLQPSHALDIAERALAAGATGIMFMPFVHPYLSEAGAGDYYRTIIERAPCPTLIYKKAPIPSSALLLELAEDPHVVGVKYAVPLAILAGASEIETSRLSQAAHQIGTHRMGRDGRTSVVDPDLRCHDIPNLYLVGAGAFVTSTPSPPTLTIVALAIRAAEHIANGLH